VSDTTPPVFLVDQLPAGGTVVLDGEEARHAATVRRMRAGERLMLSDGDGCLARCVVEGVQAGRDAALRVLIEERWTEPEPSLRVIVVQALVKGDRGELAVELATEAGADAVLPWLQRHVAVPITVHAPAGELVPATRAHDTTMATVLVVDDEHPLRVATHRILASQGFNVLHAATASEALRVCTEHSGAIDLVVTDIFLTDWRGHELASRVHEMHPGVKFLFVSGDPKARDLVKDGAFLAKPFSKQQLIDSVGSILLGAA